MCDIRQTADRHNGSRLVVCQHHGEQRGIAVNKPTGTIDHDHTGIIHRQSGNLPSLPLQPVARPSGGGMLHLRGDRMSSPIFYALRDAEDGQVVRLRPTRGEENLLGFAYQKRGNLFSRPIYSSASPSSVHVRARRISEVLFQPGQHFLYDLGMCRSGCIMIEIGRIAHDHLQNQYFSNRTFPACHQRLGRCIRIAGRGTA